MSSLVYGLEPSFSLSPRVPQQIEIKKIVQSCVGEPNLKEITAFGAGCPMIPLGVFNLSKVDSLHVDLISVSNGCFLFTFL